MHPKAGTIRADHCGALMLGGQKVTGLSESQTGKELVTCYRNTPGRPVGIPAWEFSGPARAA
ncbi:hypothetical protein [Methylobacterium oxalidis]|uniref:Uncharacterized protein n=1 Tax=Methylobacterium oxalidis TaxID=944322 RepID=A0A512IZG5_9HYPH|nr:hypothetical protein [Methylobacterium oxalidis]GEP03065.1 hypothetical protein MOX02_11030 [Methylobacterium oxalidis]GJE32831.1 hypothetical protein LDDCCGHA_3025 [Methylobacterium oxalidis]GLS67324.1 hypothetical protein GCM10007888_57080 [Methylobacterium oxalidis]